MFHGFTMSRHLMFSLAALAVVALSATGDCQPGDFDFWNVLEPLVPVCANRDEELAACLHTSRGIAEPSCAAAAIRCIEENLVESPTDDGLVAAKACVHAMKGEWQEAKFEIDRAVALAPQVSGYHGVRAGILRELGDSKGAQREEERSSALRRRAWETLVSENPDDPAAHMRIARKERLEGRYDRALLAYDAYFAIGGEVTPDVLREYAYLTHILGDTALAVQAINRALDMVEECDLKKRASLLRHSVNLKIAQGDVQGAEKDRRERQELIDLVRAEKENDKVQGGVESP